MAHDVEDTGSKMEERSYTDGEIVGRSDMERGGGDPEDVTGTGGGCGSSRVAKCACTYDSSACKFTTCFYFCVTDYISYNTNVDMLESDNNAKENIKER